MAEDYKITDPEEMKVTDVGPAPHPGGFLRSLLTEDFGLSVKQAAELLGVDRAGLTLTMQGKYAITADLALKVQALTGFDPMFLLQMQALHDVEGNPKREEYARTIQRRQSVGEQHGEQRAA